MPQSYCTTRMNAQSCFSFQQHAANGRRLLFNLPSETWPTCMISCAMKLKTPFCSHCFSALGNYICVNKVKICTTKTKVLRETIWTGKLNRVIVALVSSLMPVEFRIFESIFGVRSRACKFTVEQGNEISDILSGNCFEFYNIKKDGACM